MVAGQATVPVLRVDPDTEPLDLAGLLWRLYPLLREDRHAFAADCVRGLQRLGMENPRWDAAGDVLRWDDPHYGSHAVRWGGPAHGVTPERLRFLERIGQTVLDDAPTPAEYGAWSTAGRGVRDGPGAVRRGVVSPPWWAPLRDGVLACWRGLYGEVGLHWLLPVLYAMHAEALRWPDAPTAEVRVPPGPRHRLPPPAAPEPVPPPPRPDLPWGCEWAVRRWPRHTWAFLEGLIDFLSVHQCTERPAHAPPGSAARLYAAERGPGARLPDPQFHDLYVLTVAGVPLATAGVAEHVGDALHLETLCAASGSGGGAALVRHLLETELPRRGCTRCTADAGPAVAERFFVRRLGFAYLGPDASPALVWPAAAAAAATGSPRPPPPPRPPRAGRAV